LSSPPCKSKIQEPVERIEQTVVLFGFPVFQLDTACQGGLYIFCRRPDGFDFFTETMIKSQRFFDFLAPFFWA
jgi:hypothetical protein